MYDEGWGEWNDRGRLGLGRGGVWQQQWQPNRNSVSRPDPTTQVHMDLCHLVALKSLKGGAGVLFEDDGTIHRMHMSFST